MKLKPLKNDMLVRPKEIKKVTEGGIYDPNAGNHHPFNYGEVVAIGPDVSTLSIGDVVAIGAKFLISVKHGEETVWFLQESNIAAKLEDYENDFEE